MDLTLFPDVFVNPNLLHQVSASLQGASLATSCFGHPQRGDQPATLAVRAGLEEVEFVKEFAQFRVESLCFVLVQGRKGQIRASCAAPYRSLELAAQQVASAASSTLADLGTDANYVTASEDPEVKMERAMDEESSSQSAESSEDEGDPVLALLKKQTEKSKAESSTRRGNRSVREELGQKSTSRYPFLDQRARAGKKASGDMDQLLNPAQVSKDDIGTLVSLEILKTLKKSRKKGRARSSSRSSEASSSSSRGQQVKPIGTAKAFRNYRKARKALRRKPLRHVKRYLQEIEDFLGCDQSTPYRLADFTKKLSWGKMRTLQRCHLMTSEALQLLLQGNVEETALQLVLNLRAMYQCSLDGGSWTSAWLLTYLPDPLEKPRFGGEAQDLEIIAGYLKAMQELEKKGNKWNHQDHENEESKGKPKGRGKHGKKEHPAEERELK